MSADALMTGPAFSSTEWKTRVEMAALFRIVAHYGMSDLVNGAICARVPDQPGPLPRAPIWYVLGRGAASDMIKIDADGQPVDPGAL